MADDFYPFVDSGDPAPDNRHITGVISDDADDLPAVMTGQVAGENHGSKPTGPEVAPEQHNAVAVEAQRTETEPATQNDVAEPAVQDAESTVYATRIAVYDDMLSTPRVLVVQPKDPRSYLEEVTNTVYKCMKEQGGSISLMVIRELVENFIHAHFTEPIVSVLDGGNTIRFADQGPGISDKERAFEFGVTSANRSMKRYIRGTGAGLPMVQQYLENAGGAVSIEDNMGAGTVVTVSVDPARVAEIEAHSGRGAAVRGTQFTSAQLDRGAAGAAGGMRAGSAAGAGAPFGGMPGNAAGMPGVPGAAANAPADPTEAEFSTLASPYEQAPYNQQPPVPGQGYGAAAYPSYPTPGYPTPGYPAPGWPQQTGYQAQPYGAPYGYPGQPYPQAPGAMPAQSFQQFGQKFSTIQQSPYQTGEMGMPYAMPQADTATPTGEPFLTERALQALDFLAQHGQCGPTELTAAYGHSGPTWSRELATLSGYGFAAKHGRKYFLTELGSAWVAEHRTQG